MPAHSTITDESLLADQLRDPTADPVAPNLPDKLSDLLETALDEFQKLENDPHYLIDMNVWHYPSRWSSELNDYCCAVCLAGAVIAKSNPPGRNVYPDDFCEITTRKLNAIDYLRRSRVVTAYIEISQHDPNSADYENLSCIQTRNPIPDYWHGSKPFTNALRKLVIDLREYCF